jgi:hypothetical protein
MELWPRSAQSAPLLRLDAWVNYRTE